MSTYQINGLLKFAEEDNWEEGCLPDTGTCFEVTGHWTGETPEQVIEKVANYLGVDLENGIERDACEEPGRVDFAVTEDADSTPLSKEQIERWKKGEIKAWYSVYTGIVERVEPVALTTPAPAGTETPACKINPLHEAAPDLLDALRGLLGWMDWEGCTAEEIVAARAAIAKAEAGTETPTREINPLHEAAPDLLDVLKHILAAHKSDNNGAVNGEAKLCKMFEDQAEAAIAKAEGGKK